VTDDPLSQVHQDTALGRLRLRI